MDRLSFTDRLCAPMDQATLKVRGSFTREPDLVVPRGLTATAAVSERVQLQWWPTGVVANVEAEYNVDGGPWIGISASDVTDGSAILALNEYMPELSTLGFRIMFYRDGQPGPGFSDPVFWRRPLSPPTYLQIIPISGDQQVNWYGRSVKATGVILERGLEESPGNFSWEMVGTFPGANGTTLVTGLLDDREYWYRATYIAGADRSESLIAGSLVPTPIAPPRGLVAVAAGDGVDLSWVNVSTRVTEIRVFRWADGTLAFDPIAILPATAWTFHDAVAAHRAWNYWLEVRHGYNRAYSEQTRVVLP